MSLTVLNWPLIVTLFAITALVLLQPRARRSDGKQPNLETGKAHRENVVARLEHGNVYRVAKEAAQPPRPAGSSSPTQGRGLGRPAATLLVPVAVFLLFAGVGATAYYMGGPSAAIGAGDTSAAAEPASDPDGQMLADLTDYSRSIASGEPAAAASGELLPDVSTMIERLAARLKTAPTDIDGWRMLGWSYFHTGAYAKAASAYAKARALDPGSAELKLAFEEAAAKASQGTNLATTAPLPATTAGEGDDGPGVEQAAGLEAMRPRERDAAIRSMVDRLAARLESAPRDVDGWTRLMRSRVVLGEREVAAIAFRKALEVFKDDTAASTRITSAATALGLKPQ